MILKMDNRDLLISFDEENHVYTIKNIKIKPISVTTLIHKYFPVFNADNVINKIKKGCNPVNSKYTNLSDDDIKKLWKDNADEASHRGTIMHKNIENFLTKNTTTHPITKEFNMFINFWELLKKTYIDFNFYKSEWVIYDDDALIAGSIDCVLKNSKTGELIIIDWKRSKEIKYNNIYQQGYKPFENFPDCNFSHYSLQLNFYRHILETKYKEKVAIMILVILHPLQDNFMCINVDKIHLDNVWDNLNCFVVYN